MTRPLIGSCTLQLLKFDDPEAKAVFWHSSAHVLGQALEKKYGAHLTIGPPVQDGFYYDCYMGDQCVPLCLCVHACGGREASVELAWLCWIDRLGLTMASPPTLPFISTTLDSGVSQTDFKDLETLFQKATKEKQVRTAPAHPCYCM